MLDLNKFDKEVDDLIKVQTKESYEKAFGRKLNWFQRLWKFIIFLFQKAIGFCPYHGTCFNYPKRYRRNTAYYKDEMNWGYAAKCCIEEENAMYEEMWRDYYSGIL